MLCLRCIRSGLAPASTLRRTTAQLGRQTAINPTQQSRPLSVLSHLPTRPLAPAPPTSSARSAIAEDIPSTSFTQTSPTSQSLLQVRGAKRDTYNPSHIVRKRRHGFLARLRSKNGRKVLKRRRLKGRNTLSH